MNTKIILEVLIVCMLLSASVGISAGVDKKTLLRSNKSSAEDDRTFYQILREHFDDEIMPPPGWERINESIETWELDYSIPYSDPCCATVHRGGTNETQNESLISPPLDFTEYTEAITLTFYFYTSYYAAYVMDYIDLNVSISTDNGSTYTQIWSDDDITEQYPPFDWYFPENGKDIDISMCGGNDAVRIKFQYFSNNTNLSGAQELSIDNIEVWGEKTGPDSFSCSCGGPYYWCWDNQIHYTPPGVRFYGKVTNATGLLCEWRWHWGDESGTMGTMKINAYHYYEHIGTYNLTLEVIDNTTDPPRKAIDNTTLILCTPNASGLDIKMKTSVMGIKANILNDEFYNATDINWSITVRFDMLPIKENVVNNGVIELLEAGDISETLKSGYFLGFGRIHIEIQANSLNLAWISREFIGFKFGPFVLGEHKAS